MLEGLKPIKNSADAPYPIDSNEAQLQLAFLAYFEEHEENVEEDAQSPTHNDVLREWLNSNLAKKYREYCTAHPNKTMCHSDVADILVEIRSMP